MAENRKRARRRAVLIGAGAAIIAAAVILAYAIAIGGRPIALRLVVPFEEGKETAALRYEISEFELDRRRVSVEMTRKSFIDIDRMTASDPSGWDLAIGSARLADGRSSVAAPAAPLYGTLWHLYYSKAALAKAGIVPAIGAEGAAGKLAAGTAGLSELREACEAVSRAGATPIALGSLYGWPLAVWIQALMALGSSPEEAARLIESDYDLESPSLARAVADFKSLVAAGLVDPAFESKDWPSSLRDIVSGKAGFCLLNEELAAYLPPAERGKIGSLPLPGSASAGRSWAIGAVSYVARSSALSGRERREADALVRWLTSPGAAQRLSRKMGTTFFAGGKGPYLAIPSVSSAPSSPIVSRVREALAAR